jgi:hypothetical protein
MTSASGTGKGPEIQCFLDSARVVRQSHEHSAKADKLIGRRENGQNYLSCSLEPDIDATFVS